MNNKTKQPKLVKKKLSDYTQDSKNFNKGTEAGNALIEKSVHDFGAGRSLLASSDGVLIAGNKSHQNFEKAGIKNVIEVETDGSTVVVVKRTDIKSGTKKFHELALADNQTSELNYEIDTLMLDEVAAEYEIEPLDWGVEPTYIATEDEFETPEATTEIKTDIVLDDLFEIGMHRLLCGNSTIKEDVNKLMNGELADLYITDPPYGVSYAAKNKFLNAISRGNCIQTEIVNDQLSVHDCGKLWVDVFELAEKAMTDKASYYIFSAQGQDLMMMMMMMMIDKVFALKHCLIWVKNNHVLGRSDYNYKHEPFLFGWKKKGTHNFYGGFQTSVFEFDKPLKNDLHPTMKPIALLSKFIENSSLPDNIILDTFLGSGSTMVAAEQLNRKCYGIEISPEYCQVIIERMVKLEPSIKIKRNGKIWKP